MDLLSQCCIFVLTFKFLTQEEKDVISLKYAALKNDPTKSLKERNQVLVEGYWMALHRMNTSVKLLTDE